MIAISHHIDISFFCCIIKITKGIDRRFAPKISFKKIITKFGRLGDYFFLLEILYVRPIIVTINIVNWNNPS